MAGGAVILGASTQSVIIPGAVVRILEAEVPVAAIMTNGLEGLIQDHHQGRDLPHPLTMRQVIVQDLIRWNPHFLNQGLAEAVVGATWVPMLLRRYLKKADNLLIEDSAL